MDPFGIEPNSASSLFFSSFTRIVAVSAATQFVDSATTYSDCFLDCNAVRSRLQSSSCWLMPLTHYQNDLMEGQFQAALRAVETLPLSLANAFGSTD